MPRKLKISNLFLILVIVTGLFSSVNSVQAWSNNPNYDAQTLPESFQCYSLDVVFLIDQSDSMSRASGFGGSANDPKGLRIDSVKWVVDWLGDNVLAYCKQAVHRIAVVSWGGTVQTELEYAITPSNIDEWTITRQEIKSKIVSKDLIETRPKLAFAEAKNIFDRFANQAMGDLPHKRVIIFLTDGEPSAKEIRSPVTYANDLVEQVRRDFPFDKILLGREQCLDAAAKKAKQNKLKDIPRQEKNNCIASYSVDETNAYDQSTYIWSIILNPHNSYYLEVYAAFSKMSLEHAGDILPIASSSDIPMNFLNIMTRLAGVKAERLGCQNFPVEPYLQQAALSFFKIDKEITVEISYEKDGIVHTVNKEKIEGNKSGSLNIDGFTVKDYSNDNTIERYVFERPYGGMWNIKATSTTLNACDGIQAYYEPLDISPRLAEPPSTIPQYDIQPFHDPAHPYAIKYVLINKNGEGQALEPDIRYPLMLDVTLSKKGANVPPSEFTLVYDNVEKVYKSPEPLDVREKGLYEFTVTASTRYVDPKKQELRILFTDGPNIFEVLNVNPFKVEIIAPVKDEKLLLHSKIEGNPKTWLTIQPVQFRARIVDRDGNLIDPSLIYQDPTTALIGSVKSSVGEDAGKDDNSDSKPTNETIINEMVLLKPNEKHPGEFTAEIQSLNEEGTYEFSVSLSDKFNSQYRPDNRGDDVKFELYDTVWTRLGTYKLLGILAGALALMGLLILFLNRNNPVNGMLEFYNGSTHLATIPIGSGWNITNISRGTLKSYSTLGLRSLRVRKNRDIHENVDYSAVDTQGNSMNDTLIPDLEANFSGGITVTYKKL